MKELFRLAFLSLKHRKLTTILTLCSVCLSVTLLLSVERVRRGAEEGFTQSISQVDLIVGARGGPLNLLLYTVFNMGSATANISWQTYQEIKNLREVDWTIPYSLGDGHRGFRTVATNEDFYTHYHYRGEQKVELAQGHAASEVFDVVLGSDVAKTLGYHLHDPVVIAHGSTAGDGLLLHDDKPFYVVGIIKPTGTAIDQSLYITLEGMEAIHMDWKDGAAPKPGERTSVEVIKKENIKIGQITAFFLRTKSRIETLRLQRKINTLETEPMLAIIPGVALSELWRSMGYVAETLKAISWLVLVVGLMAMLIALFGLLEQRRREMSILRAMGASPSHILFLLLFEALLLTGLGALFGVMFELLLFSILEPWLAAKFGLYLSGALLTKQDIIYLCITVFFGTFVGLFPALRAMFLTLKDGLSVKA